MQLLNVQFKQLNTFRTKEMLNTVTLHTITFLIFLTHIYVLSVTVLTLWVAPPEMFCSWYRI